jgi:hypothetical protein
MSRTFGNVKWIGCEGESCIRRPKRRRRVAGRDVGIRQHVDRGRTVWGRRGPLCVNVSVRVQDVLRELEESGAGLGTCSQV